MFSFKRRNRFGNGSIRRRDRNQVDRPFQYERLENRRLLAIVPELTYIETEVDDTNGVDGLNGLFDIVVSPDGKHVYTAGTLEDGLAAFSRDALTGELTFIEALFDNTGGINGLDAVRSVAISPDGKHVYTAALLDSAVAAFSRNSTTGQLTFVEVELDIGGLVGLAGAHGVTVSPDGKHVYVAARTDHALSVFERDATTGELTFVESEFDGIGGVDGLRQAERLTVSPDGKHVYVASEGDNAVSVFSRDATTGAVTFVEAQFDGVGGVDGLQATTSVAISPDGLHAYVSSGLDLNPLDEDWLATFSRDPSTGELTFINHISSTAPLPCTPFASVLSDTVVTVSPDGKIVYATKGGALVQFSRNTSTGVLTVADAVCTSLEPDGLFAELLNPTDVAISPDGQHAYVGDLVGFLSAFHTQARVFVVDSTGDGTDANLADNLCADAIGDCTLRAAIEQANATPNLVGRKDQIRFDIPGSGPHTIAPTSSLPTITESVIIDGTSEPDFVVGGPPVVQLVGTSAGALANGIKITAGGSTVRGLTINRFLGAGIELRSGGGNLIQGNHIGIDASSPLAQGNARGGVLILNSASNTIGGTTDAARNVISGNDRYGVQITNNSSTGNVVQGNYIGTDATGTVGMGNGLSGVLVLNAPLNTIGGNEDGAGNVISGNSHRGVYLKGAGATGNLVQGNFIGTDATGTADLGNTLDGVLISQAASNTIGGTSVAARNVISGNDRYGVQITNNSSTGNLVQGNFIGTDTTGTVSVGNNLSGVLLFNAPSNTIGGTDDDAGNVISGNSHRGVYILGTGSTGNLVQGNSIGTDATGTADLGNAFSGVAISSASGNTIGGTTDAARNVISGNEHYGVQITNSSSTGNLVRGNYIGTDATGTVDLGNAFSGVAISGAGGNTIGGTTVSARNLISGNEQYGVQIANNSSTGNLVQGNFIGTDATGTGAIGNILSGVLVLNAPSNTIGGTTAGAANVISGNSHRGVFLTGTSATGNLVQGNFIGTDATGTADLGNTLDGVLISQAASNTIGGTTIAARNVISGNDRYGVHITNNSSTNNLVQGNYIGTNATGTGPIGNSLSGVLISNAPSNTIGGTVAGAANLISCNFHRGVYLTGTGATGNLVQGNFIGTDALGTGNLGNALSGVQVHNASSNSVGGMVFGAGNIIGFNGQSGVRVTGLATGDLILRNSMFANTGLGIDLNGDGITANDANDPDTGPNKLQNFPVITGVVLNGANLDITYSVPSISPNSTFPIRIEFFIADGADQEGQVFLGSDSYTTPGTKLASIPVGSAVLGTKIVATATDSGGNTSEFSANATVTS